MLKKSLMDIIEPRVPNGLAPTEINRCKWIAIWVIIQCIIVYIGASTILHCVWSPEHAYFDYDKLARIMYLFDSQYCGHAKKENTIIEIKLPNDTYGLQVLPIRWQPAIVTVSTRLSAKTRTHIELSLGVHVAWMLGAIIMRIITKTSQNISILKIILTVSLYLFVFVIIFDVSMAIVYVAHIQQSLTKGMVLRYSGYSVDFKLSHPDDFAGWIPIAASILWLRGVFVLCVNIYCCKVFKHLINNIEKTEVTGKLVHEGNFPIPEAKYDHIKDENVLYYRTGDYKPITKTDTNDRLLEAQIKAINESENIVLSFIMGFLGYWTVAMILYQTIICVIMSWLTLGCKLPPTPGELHEITLIKFLYVYDPETCGRVYFYNYTKMMDNDKIFTTVIWSLKNETASRFRRKITLWLYLHVIWTILCFATLGLRQRPCGLYVALLPFTATGVTLLGVDLVYTALFVTEIENTGTEVDILRYVDSGKKTVLYGINKSMSLSFEEPGSTSTEDTSWVALLMAYCSSKAIVQWVINFWLVKDNYFYGIAAYRKLQHHKRIPTEYDV